MTCVRCRVIWIGILLFNAGLFIYIMKSNMDKLLSNPLNTNVQIIDTNLLPFAAVTICNQNPYR